MGQTRSLTFGFLVILVACSVCMASRSKQKEPQGECMFKHPQTHFCSSDFVVKAAARMVVSEEYDNVTDTTVRKMKFKVLKVYRAPDRQSNWPPRKLIKVHTYNLTFVPEEEYLLSGTKSGKILKLHHCDWVAPWYTVTRMQNRGISGRYDSNCACMIKTDCLTASGKNVCKERNKMSIIANAKQGFTGDLQSLSHLVEKPPENPFSCPSKAIEASKRVMGCYKEHAGCYMTSSGNSCRWRTDDDYYAFCVNSDWLLT